MVKSLLFLGTVFSLLVLHANEDSYRHVMLAGGGMSVCSSMASDKCDAPTG